MTGPGLRLAPLAVLAVLFCSGTLPAQHLFTTARTGGFGSPSLLAGFSAVSVDHELGDDFTLLTVRGSIGIGRKTDVFGALNSVLGQDSQDSRFFAWMVGLHHQFVRTGVVDIGAIVRLRGNNTDDDRFEGSLLDLVGIVSLQIGIIHPYFALIYSRPFGFDLTDFQRSSAIGVEVPLGDIPRILAEATLGDRRSFGLALKLDF